MGNDVLNGYGGSPGEYDTLVGDHTLSPTAGRYSAPYGADVFTLGDRSEVFYWGRGYAVITDFDRGEGDRIQLYGSSRNDYSFDNVILQGSAVNEGIFYKGDLIGVVKGYNHLFASDLQFA